MEQQLIIDQLSGNLKKMAKAARGACGDGPAATSTNRPYSVPLTKSVIQSINAPVGLDSRKVNVDIWPHFLMIVHKRVAVLCFKEQVFALFICHYSISIYKVCGEVEICSVAFLEEHFLKRVTPSFGFERQDQDNILSV